MRLFCAAISSTMLLSSMPVGAAVPLSDHQLAMMTAGAGNNNGNGNVGNGYGNGTNDNNTGNGNTNTNPNTKITPNTLATPMTYHHHHHGLPHMGEWHAGAGALLGMTVK